jgi:hypothetical protein
MHISRIMQRTFTCYGIKTARVGIADILDFTGQGTNRLFQVQSYDAGKDIPRCSAGGASFDLNAGYPAVFQFHPVFRQAELSAVIACSLQASKPTSGERGYRPGVLSARGDNGYIFPFAYLYQMGRESRMTQKV